MAEFHSFASFGEEMLAAAFRVRDDRRPSYRSALALAGQEFKEFFQMKMEVGGPDWADLAQTTQEQRTASGFSANEPLLAGREMYDAIDFLVVGSVLNVGIKGEKHNHAYRFAASGTPRTIPMADLFLMHEIGTSRMPARPIFTDYDFFDVQAKIAHRFSEYMIANGFVFNTAGSSKAAKRFRGEL